MSDGRIRWIYKGVKLKINKKLKNGKSYIIRIAKGNDAQDMIKFMQKVAIESENLPFGEGEWDISVKEEKQRIEEANDSKTQYLAVAVMDKKIIGNIDFKAGEKSRILHVGEFGVSVLKEYWGNGIAKELLTSLIKWAESSENISKINLKVREDNKRAIELYRCLGFRVEGFSKRSLLINGKYYNSYLMGKIINDYFLN